jgi:hypothetical protein
MALATAAGTLKAAFLTKKADFLKKAAKNRKFAVKQPSQPLWQTSPLGFKRMGAGANGKNRSGQRVLAATAFYAMG